jgi:hypothetical protein
MKITLYVDDQVVLLASETAQRMDKTLKQVVHEYLERLAGCTSNEQDWETFEQRCLTSSARLNSWKFDREEANART